MLPAADLRHPATTRGAAPSGAVLALLAVVVCAAFLPVPVSASERARSDGGEWASTVVDTCDVTNAQLPAADVPAAQVGYLAGGTAAVGAGLGAADLGVVTGLGATVGAAFGAAPATVAGLVAATALLGLCAGTNLASVLSSAFGLFATPQPDVPFPAGDLASTVVEGLVPCSSIEGLETSGSDYRCLSIVWAVTPSNFTIGSQSGGSNRALRVALINGSPDSTVANVEGYGPPAQVFASGSNSFNPGSGNSFWVSPWASLLENISSISEENSSMISTAVSYGNPVSGPVSSEDGRTRKRVVLKLACPGVGTCGLIQGARWALYGTNNTSTLQCLICSTLPTVDQGLMQTAQAAPSVNASGLRVKLRNVSSCWVKTGGEWAVQTYTVESPWYWESLTRSPKTAVTSCPEGSMPEGLVIRVVTSGTNATRTIFEWHAPSDLPSQNPGYQACWLANQPASCPIVPDPANPTTGVLIGGPQGKPAPKPAAPPVTAAAAVATEVDTAGVPAVAPPTTPDPPLGGPGGGGVGSPAPGDASCWPTGWGWFNPVEWVLKPIKCAMLWLFVPSSSDMAAVGARVQGLLSKPPLQWASGAITMISGSSVQVQRWVDAGPGCVSVKGSTICPRAFDSFSFPGWVTSMLSVGLWVLLALAVVRWL